MSEHTSHDLHLRNAMAIPQHDANLRRCGALLREFADLVFHGIGCDLEPGWCCAGVWDGGGADALAVAVQATHFDGVVGSPGGMDGWRCLRWTIQCVRWSVP